MRNSIEKAIIEYFKERHPMPQDVKTFANLASWDLWNGPLTYCETCGVDHLKDCECGDLKYPGFSKACDIVSEWVSENVHDLYVEDWSDCVLECEPEGRYVDENGDDSDEENGTWEEPSEFWLIDKNEILAILFDKELISYIR